MSATPPPRLCRPERLTCRWVREITDSICVVCPSSYTCLPLVPPTPENVEVWWNQYWSQLSNHQCIKHPLVQQIIAFEKDYRDFLR